MSEHADVKVIPAETLNDRPRWRAACKECRKLSAPWLDADDARAELADMPCDPIVVLVAPCSVCFTTHPAPNCAQPTCSRCGAEFRTSPCCGFAQRTATDFKAFCDGVNATIGGCKGEGCRYTGQLDASGNEYMKPCLCLACNAPKVLATMGEERTIIGAVRVLEESVAAKDAEIATLRAERDEAREALSGHGEPCYYCADPCNALAGDPGRWPIAMCHADEPGRMKWHHTRCVESRCVERDELSKLLPDLREIAGTAHQRACLAESRLADLAGAARRVTDQFKLRAGDMTSLSEVDAALEDLDAILAAIRGVGEGRAEAGGAQDR